MSEHDCINKPEDRYGVKWNPFNKVVQCHVCGHVFIPKVYPVVTEFSFDGETIFRGKPK